jgi:tetrahydromethanopterin S-methyltransferase subunit C
MRHPADTGGPVIVRCLATLSGATLFVLLSMSQAVAQQGDLNLIFQRFKQPVC